MSSKKAKAAMLPRPAILAIFDAAICKTFRFSPIDYFILREILIWWSSQYSKLTRKEVGQHFVHDGETVSAFFTVYWLSYKKAADWGLSHFQLLRVVHRLQNSAGIDAEGNKLAPIFTLSQLEHKQKSGTRLFINFNAATLKKIICWERLSKNYKLLFEEFVEQLEKDQHEYLPLFTEYFFANTSAEMLPNKLVEDDEAKAMKVRLQIVQRMKERRSEGGA